MVSPSPGSQVAAAASSPSAAVGRSRPALRDGLVPLPGWLLAACPWVPLDVYILGPREPILYASRGTPAAPLLERIAAGVDLWGMPVAPDRYVTFLVGALARSADPQVGSLPERARTMRRVVRALLDMARGRTTEQNGPRAGGSGDARRAASAGIVAAAAILSPLLVDNELARAVLGTARADVPIDPLVERSIDGAIYGALLARQIGLGNEPDAGWPFLAGMLLRDLALLSSPSSSRAPSRTSLEGHPLEAVALLRPLLRRHPTALDSVVRHHERPDGSGYPRGLGIGDVTDLDLVGASADAMAGAFPPTGPAGWGAMEALGVVRFAIGRRFPSRFLAGVSEVIAAVTSWPQQSGTPRSASGAAPAVTFRGDEARLGGRAGSSPQRPA